MNMVITGKIRRVKEGWFAYCDLVGAYTQGRSLADAKLMLADCVETLLDHKGVRVTCTEVAQERDEHVVELSANEPALLARLVLLQQRAKSGLSLAEVARKLGASSRTAYARYEQGASSPSLDKFVELLEAVAPDLVLTIAPRQRKPTKLAPAKRKTRRGAA